MRRGSTEWQIWGLVRKAALPMPRRNMTFLQHKPLHEMKSETGPFLRKIAEVKKAQMPPRRSVGGRKPYRTQKPPIGGALPRKEQQKALLRPHGQTMEARRHSRGQAFRVPQPKTAPCQSAGSPLSKWRTGRRIPLRPLSRRSRCKVSRSVRRQRHSERRSGRCFRNPRRAAEGLPKSLAARQSMQ